MKNVFHLFDRMHFTKWQFPNIYLYISINMHIIKCHFPNIYLYLSVNVYICIKESQNLKKIYQKVNLDISR